MFLQQLHLVLQIAGVLYGRILQLLHALTDPIFSLQHPEAPELAQQLPGILGLLPGYGTIPCKGLYLGRIHGVGADS